MKQWASAVWAAIRALWRQNLLWLDQGGNVWFCGLVAIVVAAFTGAKQAVAFADETLSAHAWRSYERKRLWGRLWKPVIDWMFAWQPQDAEVNARAGKPWLDHCERAFWKEIIRREMPPEYREAR